MTYKPQPYRTNDVTMIFKSDVMSGEVWRDDVGNYGTYGAGHQLCVELAKEVERLRKELAEIHKSWGIAK